MLDEIAASCDVHDLKAAADREGRDVAREGRLEQSQLGAVPAPLRLVGLRVRIGTVGIRADVGAARKDDPVEHVERLLDPALCRRDEERTPTGSLDRIDVVEWDERCRKVPRTPLRLLRVRGDADDRFSLTLQLWHGTETPPRPRRGSDASV